MPQVILSVKECTASAMDVRRQKGDHQRTCAHTLCHRSILESRRIAFTAAPGHWHTLKFAQRLFTVGLTGRRHRHPVWVLGPNKISHGSGDPLDPSVAVS